MSSFEAYDFEQDRIVSAVRDKGAKRILLQMPEGLKPAAFKLAREIESKTGAEVIVSGDPCYGACDLAIYPKERLNANLLVHVGHAEIPGEGPSEGVLYVEAHAKVDIDKPLTEALEMLTSEKRIALAASIQHIHMLKRAKEFFEANGKAVEIGRPSGWLKYPGQVLGCDYASVMSVGDRVDAVVVVSGGDFHALGIPLATRKRTIVVDPFQQKARDLTTLVDKILRQRYATILKFQKAKRIGVIAGLKSSQMNLSLVRRLRQLLEDNGRETVLLSAVEIVPDTLESFVDIDAFVEIGCPRISIDDRQRYRKPILNPEEVMIALGKKAWEDYGLESVPGQWH